ncbi:EAL domain-containing protein [uncultured Enterovirga sp.]|uniref:EAL domain-containing protein n=1 Tax=uncultured Enterovirga sp. TaxID=2026352 RepID=UPI0035C9AED4
MPISHSTVPGMRSKTDSSCLNPACVKEVERPTTLLREISAGLKAEEFVLYYQPLVGGAKPRVVTGFEALTSWRLPVRRVLTPDKFLTGVRRPRTLARVEGDQPWPLATLGICPVARGVENME